MKTASMNMYLIDHSKPQKAVVQKAHHICLPSPEPYLVKIKERKSSSGGYMLITPSVAAADTRVDVNSASDSSYSDFIHYNYGYKD